MTLIWALARNMRPWTVMVRERRKRKTREAESTDAPDRFGLPHSSDEGGVIPVERRGWVTRVATGRVNGQPEELTGRDGRR